VLLEPEEGGPARVEDLAVAVADEEGDEEDFDADEVENEEDLDEGRR
jgi:hypothetical protein